MVVRMSSNSSRPLEFEMRETPQFSVLGVTVSSAVYRMPQAGMKVPSLWSRVYLMAPM